MAKSIIDNSKSRGRPKTTGSGTLVGVRMVDEPLKALDDWIECQRDPDFSRPEAIRRLVGLAGATTGRPKKAPTSSKSSELAAAAIDKLADETAPADEQAARKRRLLKGPEEFQGLRVNGKEKEK
jgi:hypothetical protein